MYLEKGQKVAATLSDLKSCLLKPPHGSPSQNTFHIPKRAVRRVEIPGASQAGDARSRSGHSGRDGTGWSHTCKDWPVYARKWAVGHHVTHQPCGQPDAVVWVCNVQLNSSQTTGWPPLIRCISRGCKGWPNVV